MKRRSLTWLLTLFAALLAPAAAEAQLRDWLQQLDAAREALDAGELAAAERSLEAALEAARRCPEPDLHRAQTLEWLAGLYYDQERDAEAARISREAHALAAPYVGERRWEVGADLLHRGAWAERAGEYEHAEDLYRRAHAAREAIAGPGSAEAALALIRLGTVTCDLGRSDEALEHHRRALAILEEIYGPEHGLVAYALQALGETQSHRWEHPEAAARLERFLVLAERSPLPLYDLVDRALEELAWIQEMRGDSAEPAERQQQELEALHQRRLEYVSEHWGPESPRAAAALISLGWFYQWSAEEPQRAEESFRRAITILERSRGPAHEETVQARYALAYAYEQSERLDEAETLYQLVVDAVRAAHGPEDLRTGEALTRYGDFLTDQQKYEESLEPYLQALAIQREGLGPDDLELATGLIDVGYAYHRLARYEDAEPLYEEALALYEALLGHRDPATVWTRAALADLYLDQGKLGQAFRCYFRPAGIWLAEAWGWLRFALLAAVLLGLGGLWLIIQALRPARRSRSSVER